MNFDYNLVNLTVISGVGGDDAKDWARMLLKMYLNYAKKKNWKVKFISDNSIEIKGEKVYEILKDEAGVHRLVRISPFDPKKLRHTSFALVEVLPGLPPIEEKNFEIPSKDLKFEFFRASGPGGQNVNKVETAVRVVHLPTGLTVTCQTERSQSANREKALSILKTKILKFMEEKRIDSLESLKTKASPEWAHEIRSYILHPYKQIKDHRTNKKITQVEEVLEGNLDLLK